VVNLLAMIWVAFLCVVLSIPDGFRTGRSILAVLVMLGLWYFLRERKHFEGPRWRD
jgi:dipeptide/tripeptide permease